MLLSAAVKLIATLTSVRFRSAPGNATLRGMQVLQHNFEMTQCPSDASETVSSCLGEGGGFKAGLPPQVSSP